MLTLFLTPAQKVEEGIQQMAAAVWRCVAPCDRGAGPDLIIDMNMTGSPPACRPLPGRGTITAPSEVE